MGWSEESHLSVCTEDNRGVRTCIEDKQRLFTHEESSVDCETSLGRTNCSIWLTIPAVPGKTSHAARHA